MKTRQRAMSLLSAGAIAVCVGALSATVIAAENDQSQSVRIQASKPGTVTLHSRAGVQDEVAQLSQRVSYRDLDLATTNGTHELANRIERAATSVCARLAVAYPASPLVMESKEESLCVSGAVDGAMKQVTAAVASAERQSAER